MSGILGLLIINLGVLYDDSDKAYNDAVDEAVRLHYEGDIVTLTKLYEATTRLIHEESKVELIF